MSDNKNLRSKLAVRLMETYLKEMGVIKKEMTLDERLDIMEHFIMRYPKKLMIMFETVNQLSIPEDADSQTSV